MSPSDPPPDPFAAYGSDRTVIKPSAGRAARAEPAPSGPAPAPAAAPEVALPELPAHASLNPLVQAAAPLLSAAPRLRATLRHPDPAGLRATLVEAVRRFESVARAQGLPNEQVVAARYILCTLLDEAASGTPWGGSGAWASQSLLVHFHNEAWGGEKVFQLLTRLAESPAQHRNLLELVYAALALGFEGRYRVMDNGRAQLDSLRERLAGKLRELAGPVDRSLSTQWQGVVPAPARLGDGVPLWAVAAVLAFLLMGLFLVLRLTLNASTDATFDALQALDLPTQPAPPPAVPAAPAPPRLAALLKDDILAGALAVSDLPDRSIITLRGDSLFDPGSADVAPRALPLFQHIGAALARLPGTIVIAGYTDNQPIRSLRFPSNWHLSKARADHVMALLSAAVPPGRMSAEGRADADPVADNATPAGRAKNRRVEITLLVAAPSS
ncbi:MAG: DotU family type VI secretion system protein [Burkholderiales bacterium]|nr:DotU family type VI secretion system protein [Burkholderiales bacterium]